MAEWQERPWKAGTPVEVFDTEMNLIGVGKLLKDYNPLPPDEDDNKLVTLEEALESLDEDDIPQIEMEDGTVILGCDCFWMPVEETEKIKKEHGLGDYVVNVRAEGYAGLAMNVKVTAKNPDEATTLACSREPRFNEGDPYVLLVYVNEDDQETDDAETSVFCTYPTLAVALSHVKTITGGRWMLIEKDFSTESEGIILKTWEEYEESE